MRQNPSGYAKSLANGDYVLESGRQAQGYPRIRRLTPTECERLMSWPDCWTRWGTDENGNKVEISVSQRYKLIGNGVVSEVVRHVIREVILK